MGQGPPKTPAEAIQNSAPPGDRAGPEHDSIPSSDVDLYSGQTLLDPYNEYRSLRDTGPVVWLQRLNVYAVTRYGDVRRVLRDANTFRSGDGVALNERANSAAQHMTLTSDGEIHQRFRQVIGRPMTPKALSDLRPPLQAIADELADRLVARRTFDAVTDLAEVIPSGWVPDLLGWPVDGREHLLQWGADTFDVGGPPNERCHVAGPGSMEMLKYARRVAAEHRFPVGSMGAGVLAAAANGEIDVDQCPALLVDYLGPSLDTTISALGSAIWLFGNHPEQWDLLRKNPNRAHNAFNEVLRLESPLTGFTRVSSSDADIDGVTVPAGSRVLVLYASANRDERRWDRPDEFDISRDASGQVAFGHGVHACAGMGLARLEAAAVLAALVPRVRRFTVGPSTRRPNNLIRAFASIPTTVQPA
jgi:cytochrome P450